MTVAKRHARSNEVSNPLPWQANMGVCNDVSKQPLVSVVIPTFNRVHIIARSVDSALAQRGVSYEIIVVDDGSTDGTGMFIRKRYGASIRYIAHDKNRGLSAARNTGINCAVGKYIAILDDDDIWLPDKLALQVELLEYHPEVVLAYCGTLKVNARGELLEEIKPSTRGHIFSDMLYRNCLMGPASVAMFRRSVLSASGSFNLALSSCADWDLWIRISRCGCIDYVDRPLVHYVIHENNMHSDISGMARDTFAILDTYLPHLHTKGMDRDRCDAIYSSHLVHFAWEYFHRNDLMQFRHLLLQALMRYPLQQIPITGVALQEKEREVLEMRQKVWNTTNIISGKERSRILRDHYIQLAWEYARRQDGENFRRCIIQSWRHAFPRIPFRLAIPWVKSFMGRA